MLQTKKNYCPFQMSGVTLTYFFFTLGFCPSIQISFKSSSWHCHRRPEIELLCCSNILGPSGKLDKL